MSKPNTKTDETISADEVSGPDGIDKESLEEAIASLTPEQTEIFMRALTLTMRKRKLMLMGNLLALLVILIGMILAFITYANREPGSFTGWVFLVPLGGAGFCMWFFGRLAKRAGAQTHEALISKPDRPSSETASKS